MCNFRLPQPQIGMFCQQNGRDGEKMGKNDWSADELIDSRNFRGCSIGVLGVFCGSVSFSPSSTSEWHVLVGKMGEKRSDGEKKIGLPGC